MNFENLLTQFIYEILCDNADRIEEIDFVDNTDNNSFVVSAQDGVYTISVKKLYSLQTKENKNE